MRSTYLVVGAPRGTPGSFVDDALAAIGRTRRIALAVPHVLVVPYLIASSDLIGRSRRASPKRSPTRSASSRCPRAGGEANVR